MANILISYYSDYGEVLYDAISDELLKNGNNVFRLNINTPRIFRSQWGGDSEIMDKTLYDDIIRFSPDIILNFNHSFPQNCHLGLKQDCKNCIVDADNPETFWNKKLYKKNKDKYIYLGLQSYSKKMYEDSIGRELTEDVDFLYFPPATLVENQKLHQDKNISFIGSNFFPLHVPPGEDFYKKISHQCYDAFKKDYFFKKSEAYKMFGKISGPDWLYEKIRCYYVGQERLKFLQNLTDLGLTIFGSRWWDRIAFYDFELAKSYNPRTISSNLDSQWVYNTSKISINISHPQARTSFSWRVMDIMASNSCLLMEDKLDWRNLFEKYLSPQTIETVIYKDRFDMREKAIKLLNDNELRQKCVAELNEAIEKNGRWKHRISLLEKFLNVNLLGLDNTSLEYVFIRQEVATDAKSSIKQAKTSDGSRISKKYKKGFIERLKLKQRFILAFYLTLLIIAQIPIIDCLIPKKQRLKMHHMLETYKR